MGDMCPGFKNFQTLHMKKFLVSAVLLSFSAAFYGYAELTDSQTKALDNIDRAMAVIDATWKSSIKGSATNMYLADTYNTVTKSASGPSDVWPYTAAIEAHNSLIEALEEVKDIAPELYAEKFGYYKEHLDQLIDNLEYYRGTYRLSSYATSNVEWSPFAVPRASQRGAANVSGILNVYDDQMWLARELIRAYRVTGNEDYLDEAAYLTDYVLEGWDCWRDENGKEYGGITWGPGYNSKHACSNAPIIQPLVWLHDIYKDRDDEITYYYRDETNIVKHEDLTRGEHYLNFARKVYDWQKEKLQHSSGCFWDMMGADGKIIVSRGYRQHVDCGGPTGNLYSYNTGTMIAGAAELYRVTDEQKYLDDLSSISKSSLSQFAAYKRTQGTYDFTTDQVATSGFNTWFNDVLIRSYFDAVPYSTNNSAKTGLNAIQTNLDFAFENHNRDNLLPIHLLTGWGNEEVTKGFHQFAFASLYGVLAQYQMMLDREAGVEDAVVDADAESSEVYDLKGRAMGTLDNVQDTLHRDIYIVGSKKVVLGK